MRFVRTRNHDLLLKINGTKQNLQYGLFGRLKNA